MKKKAKVMKLGKDEKLDKAVYTWLRQKRMDGVPVSGPCLVRRHWTSTVSYMEKKQLLRVMDGDGDSVKGMESVNCLFKERSSLLIKMQLLVL